MDTSHLVPTMAQAGGAAGRQRSNPQPDNNDRVQPIKANPRFWKKPPQRPGVHEPPRLCCQGKKERKKERQKKPVRRNPGRPPSLPPSPPQRQAVGPKVSEFSLTRGPWFQSRWNDVSFFFFFVNASSHHTTRYYAVKARGRGGRGGGEARSGDEKCLSRVGWRRCGVLASKERARAKEGASYAISRARWPMRASRVRWVHSGRSI